MGLPDQHPDPFVTSRVRIRVLPSSSKNSNFLSLKNDVNVPVIRIQIRIRIRRIHMFLTLPDPHPDPLIRGMDSRIMISQGSPTLLNGLLSVPHLGVEILAYDPFCVPPHGEGESVHGVVGRVVHDSVEEHQVQVTLELLSRPSRNIILNPSLFHVPGTPNTFLKQVLKSSRIYFDNPSSNRAEAKTE